MKIFKKKMKVNLYTQKILYK